MHQVWVAADPTNPDYERHPLFRKATPIDVEVRAGEVLFLPYMWFHQVGQVYRKLARLFFFLFFFYFLLC